MQDSPKIPAISALVLLGALIVDCATSPQHGENSPANTVAITSVSVPAGSSVASSSPKVVASPTPRPVVAKAKTDAMWVLDIRDDKDPSDHGGGVESIAKLEQLLEGMAPSSPSYVPTLTELAHALGDLRRSTTGDASVRAARRAATVYQTLTNLSPPIANRDHLLYRSALENEVISNFDEARLSYMRILQMYPGSQLEQRTYLSFAELFLADVASDGTKIQFALTSYEQVLRSPDRGDGIYTLALVRLFQIHRDLNEDDAATELSIQAKKSLETFPSMPGAPYLSSKLEEPHAPRQDR